MNVLFRFDLDPRLRPLVERLEGMSVALCSEADVPCLEAALAEADALWHVLRPVDAAQIEAAPRLRLIQKIGVGVNTIDLGAARRAGVAVCNMPGSNSRAVAELTLALMLACLRRLPPLDRLMRAGRGWQWPAGWQGGFGEVGGRTVGLVGAGGVPRALIPVLSAMGAEVLVFARTVPAEVVALGARAVGKPELLARSDVLSLHIPQTEETVGWLDRASIAAMKPGAILLNTARGGLVDEPALVEALTSGHLAAAGLDVFASEPLPPDSPLLRLDNVVMTPHIAWLTVETLARSIAIAADNVRRLRDGRELLHRVA